MNPLIKEYERYQLQWMQDHGFSVKNLIDTISDMADEMSNTDEPYVMVQDAYDNFLHDTGFSGQIWACRDEWLEEKWHEFADIPVIEFDTSDSLGMAIEEPFYCYDIGTPQEDIWHDFDNLYSKGLHALMFPDEKVTTDAISR